MKPRSAQKLAKVGERIGTDLTVLGLVDGDGVEPVYIVWHHRAWCPMACKTFATTERAEHEAKILSAFAHPGVVRCLDVGAPANLLMPFLEGRTLASVLDRANGNRLSVSDALRLTIHAGAALQHVHDRGYLHLDVKPANIMVTRAGSPVLFDFGIARPVDSNHPSKVEGTDLYIAPEMCRLEPVGKPADVFGLGATLYEALTGQLPFVKSTARKPYPQTTDLPKPPRQLRPSIPRGLSSLVMSCLDKMPEQRPPLAELLITLNGHITSGARMWPSGFEPHA